MLKEAKKEHDVVIIGAGPAGIAAAIYLKRAGIMPIMLEKDSPGGTLNKTHIVENYPGYTDKDGTTLAFRMYSQIEEFGIELRIENVINILKENKLFKVITEKDEYIAKYIIIATGKIPRKLDALNAEKYFGKGVSYCTICDGALYKNKDVSIIGGGNSALEAASYMSNIAKNVYIINRSSNLRADEKEQSSVLTKKNVKVIYNSKVTEVIGDNEKITAIKLNGTNELKVEAVFVCIGGESNSAYYQNLNLETDKRGIIVNNSMKTNANNVYACGDAISKDLYQIVTAVSEGAIAATSIIKELKK